LPPQYVVPGAPGAEGVDAVLAPGAEGVSSVYDSLPGCREIPQPGNRKSIQIQRESRCKARKLENDCKTLNRFGNLRTIGKPENDWET
jgi:hypothetical protein